MIPKYRLPSSPCWLASPNGALMLTRSNCRFVWNGSVAPVDSVLQSLGQLVTVSSSWQTPSPQYILPLITPLDELTSLQMENR